MPPSSPHHYFCAVLGMNEEVDVEAEGGEVDREERSKKIAAGGLASQVVGRLLTAETEDEKKAEIVSGDVVM